MQYQDRQIANQRYGILASHCCICRLALVDAKSIQLGIGPVCEKKYAAKPTIETTPQMLMRALGLVAASPLPGEVKAEVIKHKHNARDVCNQLIYHASANYRDKVTVLAVSPIIRALGYTTLADKLEADRTRLTLRVMPDGNLDVRTPYSPSCYRDMRNVAGHRWLQKPRGCNWIIPADKREHVMLVLGVHFGNEDASTEDGVIHIPRKTWIELRDFVNPPKPAMPLFTPPTAAANPVPTKAVAGCQVVDKTDRVCVHTPYNMAYIIEIKKVAGRKWNATDKCWEVPLVAKSQVLDIIKTVYGVTI